MIDVDVRRTRWMSKKNCGKYMSIVFLDQLTKDSLDNQE